MLLKIQNSVQKCMPPSTNICTRTYMHAPTHPLTHPHTYTHTHTHKHTHTHTLTYTSLYHLLARMCSMASAGVANSIYIESRNHDITQVLTIKGVLRSTVDQCRVCILMYVHFSSGTKCQHWYTCDAQGTKHL